jgi:hypothetical protein
VIAARPWAVVTIDGKPQGQTPLTLRLPAGRHRVVIEAPDGTRETVRLDLEPDENERIDRDYRTPR